MESLKTLIWEKGNDKNVQATWYGLILNGEKRVLVFSIRPSSNDKKTGYFLNCLFTQLLKLNTDITLYDTMEEARNSAEKAYVELVGVFINSSKTKSKENFFQ